MRIKPMTFYYPTLIAVLATIGLFSVGVLVVVGARAIAQHWHSHHANRANTIADDHVNEIDLGGN